MACVDPDADRRAAFAERWGVPIAVAAMVDLPSARYDVVSIASPTTFHSHHLAAALALKPKLIFCDKPVTLSADETRRWVDAVQAAGVLLAINHTRRWAPDLVALAVELHSGTHGAVRSATGFYGKGVLNNGAHMIDLLHMLLGPVRVLAAGAPVADYWDDDPTIPAMLEAGGVPVQLSIGDARDYARFELEIMTEAGVVTMADGGQAWQIRRAAGSGSFIGYRVLDAGERTPGRYDEAMLAAVANIHNALTNATPLASDGASALAAQIVCERIRELSKGPQ